MSIDDVAHATRIQSNFIRGLENDDYSNFASTTYAKSFLSLYSRYLDIDAEEALSQFDGGDVITLSGQGYLESVPEKIERSGSRPSRPSFSSRPASRPAGASSPGLAPIFLGVFVLALIVGIPILAFLGKDAESIDDVVSKAEDIANANFSETNPQGARELGEKAAPEPKKSAPQAGPPIPSTPSMKTSGASDRVAQVEPAAPVTARPATPPTAQPIGSVPIEDQPERKTSSRFPPIEPMRAQPVGLKPAEDSETNEIGSPTSTPAASPTQGPVRATPIVARPVTVPAEGEETESASEQSEMTEEGVVAGEETEAPEASEESETTEVVEEAEEEPEVSRPTRSTSRSNDTSEEEAEKPRPPRLFQFLSGRRNDDE